MTEPSGGASSIKYELADHVATIMGDIIDAEEALRIGLVREVAPHEELLSRARALAERITVNPPLAVRYMKEGLRRTAYGDPREIGAWAMDKIRLLSETDDHKEGVASFLEKRDPVFTGG